MRRQKRLPESIASAATSRTPRRTAVVIPVRALEGAKSRLGAVLDAEERRELVDLLLRQAVQAACGTEGVAVVAVVSPDPATLAVAVRAGAEAPVPALPIVLPTGGAH